MGSLSPNDRARERASINVRLLDLLKQRNQATEAIADALADILRIDNDADEILDELADLKRPNPGILSGQ